MPTPDDVLEAHEVLVHHDLTPLLGLGRLEGQLVLYVAVTDPGDTDGGPAWLLAATDDQVAMARALTGSDPLRTLFDASSPLRLLDASGLRDAAAADLDEELLPTADARLAIPSPVARLLVVGLGPAARS